MMDSITKEILIKRNVDLTTFQIKHGEWDLAKGQEIRNNIKGKILMLKALGPILPDEVTNKIEIEVFMLFEYYENLFVHAMGYDPRTHFTYWMRSDFILDWMIEYFPSEVSEMCMQYLELRFTSDGIEPGHLSDVELYRVLSDFFIEHMTVNA